jgi:hypothetical protein
MDPEDIGSNPTDNPTIGEIIAERLSRRDFAKGVLAVSAITAAAPSRAFAGAEEKAPVINTTPSFLFTELQAGFDETHHVAKGYYADVLIRWGDKVLFDAPRFDPYRQSASAQAKQFGYNNDFIGFIPLNPYSDALNTAASYNYKQAAALPSQRGLLVVNHEYTNSELMFPKFTGATKAIADIEMAAHGGSVLEVKKALGGWRVVPGSHYARRITAKNPDAHFRPCCWELKAADKGRPGRHPSIRHAQQLRGRRDTLGHLAHLRRKLQRIFL